MPGSRSLSLSLILFLFFPSLSLAFVSSTLRLSHHTVAPRSLSTRNSFRHEQHVGRNSNFELRMGLLDDLRAKNAEMLAVREEKDLIGKKYGVKNLQAFPCQILNTDWKLEKLAGMLTENGVLGMEKVISEETAAELLAHINAESDKAKAAVTAGEESFDDRFGGVNCRGSGTFGLRQDQWLLMSDPIVRKATEEAISNMRPLLEATVGTGALIHELSCLVADPGAPRQCIHADTIHLPCKQYPVSMVTCRYQEPLYTFFIAVQDVADNMGHTTFLPRTQTLDAHNLWNLGQKQKENMIASLPAVQSALKTGDVAIFDSRLLHAGGANSSEKRRVLFYFTLSKQHQWPLPDGLHGSNSIRAQDKGKWCVSDMLSKEPVA